MKIETSRLEGAALDWAVAKAEGWDVQTMGALARQYANAWPCNNRTPSIDWSMGGPLVDRYLIDFRTQSKGCKVLAWAAHEPAPSEGPSHLVAACKAIVRIELGNEVDVPDELAGGAP